ncbi:MAG: 3-dehydroquinate synthase II [Deltaproteobacteria bacterium]|nr:MAG: 3-dehydroquinate synthase II [Deltaproteobacteria bacterium]
MKEIWVNVDPWKKDLVTTALEAGADAVIVPPDKVQGVKELGLIKTVSDKGDLRWGKDVTRMEIQSAEDEEKIVKISKERKVVVKTSDWTIIPLENLLARAGNIFVEVATLDEAKTALGILEKGVDGLVIQDPDSAKVRDIIKEAKFSQENLELSELEITAVHPAGMGDRVCVDTCTMMKEGEGVLVGNSSRCLFLIHSESIENPYVAPRPFRVNAGPVHAYVMVPEGKTKYLSELKAGDSVMGIDFQGQTAPLLVGRVKIERRPLLLIEAKGPQGQVSVIVQNAETIRMVGPEGEALSVVRFKPGDRILGYVEEAGRHFGHKIKETITER